MPPWPHAIAVHWSQVIEAAGKFKSLVKKDEYEISSDEGTEEEEDEGGSERGEGELVLKEKPPMSEEEVMALQEAKVNHFAL